MWHYLCFIVLVKVKDSTEYTGPESYVAEMIKVSGGQPARHAHGHRYLVSGQSVVQAAASRALPWAVVLPWDLQGLVQVTLRPPAGCGQNVQHANPLAPGASSQEC